MVKVPNRPPTPVEPGPSGPEPPPELCPPLEVEVAIAPGASVHNGDPVSAQLRQERVRLLSRGQVVAWLDDETTVGTIKQCHEAGGRYRGQVAAVSAGRVVILLESHD